MSGKYSAEWWEKFASISQETSARLESSNVIDHLIQATASGRPPVDVKTESSKAYRAAAALADARVLAAESNQLFARGMRRRA
jgi:hypothetical protein